MKVFVTGVGGQLGHDCVNELISRGHEAVGSDIQGTYSGVADGSAVVVAPYVQLDITDQKAVAETVERIAPDVTVLSSNDNKGEKRWGCFSFCCDSPNCPTMQYNENTGEIIICIK